MRGDLQLFLAGCMLLGVCAFLYWRSRRKPIAARSALRNFPTLLVLCGILLCGWSVRPTQSAQTFTRETNPLVIAVAFDLSPSMLAIPNPQFEHGRPPRFERARDVLLKYFDALQEAQQRPVVAMIGFTKQAEVMMGWDKSTQQIRDVLQYGLVPDLLGNSGSSIEVALRKITDAFRMLPAEYQGSQRKLAIVVSDGESSVPPAALHYALKDLAASQYDVIALQTGLLDTNEGVASFGDLGEFLGFGDFGGRIYTVPDAAAMQSVADSAGARGLYLRAEDEGAAERMLGFSVQSGGQDKSIDATLLLAMGMFAVVVAVAACQLR
ncbi:MAG TPA: vWA domain-containing protein [Steroidobacteraceae bacterium]|nr:vWA domain-containing protein [Steroidobacteraceae bacterium]